MAREIFGSMGGEQMSVTDDTSPYHAGYDRTVREYQWARRHGWSPTQRQLVVAFMQTMRVYTAARGGKPIGGQSPEWLRGRVSALHDLIHEGAGRIPIDGERGNPDDGSDGPTE